MVLLAVMSSAWSFPLVASADFEWGVIEHTMPSLCGNEEESEEARLAAHKRESCITVAEEACEASPKGSLQAILHSEGCEIVQENAGHRSAAPEASEGGGGTDTGLIIGLAAAALVAASALWVAFDWPKRDWSSAKGPTTRLAWTIGVLLLWPIFFPLYVLQRGTPSARDATP